MEKLAPIEGTFNGCFGCGPENPRGLKLEFCRDGDGEVVANLVAATELSGYRGFVHGGVIAAILDEAMGWALLHVGGRYGVTRSMHIDYRRPVRVGKSMSVRAAISELGTKTAALTAALRDEHGRVLASAIGEWALVRNDRSV